MFDPSQLRTLNLDQLRPWCIFELQQPVRTRDGRLCPKGMEFRFEYAIANLATSDAEIHGLGPEGENLVFLAKGGEHQQWFENTGREWRPSASPRPTVTTGIAETGATRNWGSSRADGDELLASAKALAAASRPDLAAALAGKAINCYHAWMSQATSGGEGTAMQYEIRDSLREAKRLSGSTPEPNT